MGYTTEFTGNVQIKPPLNEAEVKFINKFCESRRMNRTGGPYFVEGNGYAGQDDGPDKVLDHNSPPEGQPGLWCKWEASTDGTQIHWSGAEKFYDADKWMAYLIDHFLKPNCIAKDKLDFLQANHVVNGEFVAQGEDSEDRWLLEVKNNAVKIKQGRVVYD